MYDSILVPTDGSDVAASAARTAVAVAAQFDAEVHAVHVVESEPYPGFDGATDGFARHGEAAARTVPEQANEAGVEATTAVLEDVESVPRAILSYARDHEVDLVVMGTRGRSGLDRFLLGSVTELTLRESPVPVLTVRETTTVDPPLDAILLPFDGSDGARHALDHAIGLAQATGATLHAVNVVDHATMAGGDLDTTAVFDTLQGSGERALDAVVERATGAGVDTAEPAVRVGSPFREILGYADEHDVDCIVMGTQGRSGLDRLLLGSVAERVIRRAEVPVVATRAPTDEAGESRD